jgi:hypothetical protein
MKKIYLSLFAITLASLSFSQAKLNNKHLLESKNSVSVTENKKTEKTPIFNSKTVFWTNEFSNPADWSFSNTSNPSVDWVITNDPTAAPADLAGVFSPLGFTSIGNGFAIIDSDGQGDGATQNAIMTYTGTINCSAIPAVLITFEQAHRRFYEQTFLMVSNDGGLSWTDYVVNQGMPVNTNTTNPQLVELNISAVAANQANVKIAFRYEGAWDWFWAIDDIKMSEAFGNDISLGKSWAGDIINDYDYSIVPGSQIQPLVVGVVATNLGATNAVGSAMNLTISNGTTNVHTQTVNFDLPLGVTDTIWVETGFTPAVNENLTVTFNVNPDDNTVNDISLPSLISTSTTTYAHDFTTTGVYRYDIDAETAMGQTFEIINNATMLSVDVKFETSTTAEQANVRVRRFNPDNATFSDVRTADFIVEQDFVIPTSAIGSGNFTPLTFQVPVQLEAGWFYTVEIRKYAGADRIFIGGSSAGSDDFSTIVYGPFGAGDAVNYFVSSAFSPAVRMSFEASLSVKENDALSSFNVYPNPATEKVSIDFSLTTASPIELTITDLSGKQVYASSLGNKAAGSHTVDVRTSTFAEGIYVVNFKTANGIITEKLVIKK